MRRLRWLGLVALAAALGAAPGCGDGNGDGDDAGGGDVDAGGDRDSGPLVDSGMSPVDGSTDAGGTDSGEPDGGAGDDCTLPIPELTTEVVATGLASPLYVAQPPGSTDLFVVERGGRIRIVRDGSILGTPFIDLSSRLNGTPTGDSEWGLLGLAFHPGYETNGRFFVAYTPRGAPWENVVAEGRRSAADPDRADAAVTPILTIDDDFAGNHNGGMITFGPDGMLYVGTGDGGGGGDPMRFAQNRSVLLGKILRLDVTTAGSYSVPSDNPFVGMGSARGEIWAYGLRNPWRFSFDRDSGDFWMGDVGQDTWEEIDFAPAGSAAGENYGWSAFEANHAFGTRTLASGEVHHAPITEYHHDEGGSVVGGYVYRGTAIPALRGVYLFGDSYSNFVRGMRVCGGTITAGPTQIAGLTRAPSGGAIIVSFGEDNTGELYIVYLGTGEVRRIVAP